MKQAFAGLGPAGRAFNGNSLRSPTANKVTLQLTGLPFHSAVNLTFLLAAIDSPNYKISYPVGPTPYFTGVMTGAAPRANVTLQASTGLGKNDPWQNLSSGTANENGALSFLDVPDPSAAGAARNFYRAVVTGP